MLEQAISVRHAIASLEAKQSSKLRKLIVCGLLCVPIITLWALNSGAIAIDTATLLLGQNTQYVNDLHTAILTEIRLPRIIMTFITGSGLAMCGLLLQSLCRNPLADPGLIGVSASSALFAGLGFLLLTQELFQTMPQVLFIPIMAFIGASLAIALLLAITRNLPVGDNLILILAGVAINAGAATLLGLITFVVDDQTLRQISFWSLGSYAGISWPVANVSLLVISLGGMFLWRKLPSLQLISLGEQQAAFQGLNVNRCKTQLLIVCALITAVCVSFTGIVGFVGLIVPHICRLILGTQLRLLMLACILVGGCLVVVSDTLARTLIVPAELPIGLITSILGVPFFVYLIVSAKGRSGHV